MAKYLRLPKILKSHKSTLALVVRVLKKIFKGSSLQVICRILVATLLFFATVMAAILGIPSCIDSLRQQGFLSSDEIELSLIFTDKSRQNGILAIRNISKHPVDSFSTYFLKYDLNNPTDQGYRIDFPPNLGGKKDALPYDSEMQFTFNWPMPMSDFYINKIAARDSKGVWVFPKIVYEDGWRKNPTIVDLGTLSEVGQRMNKK